MAHFSSSPDNCTHDLRIALFGPQVTHWTQESLSALQFALLQNTSLEFLTKTLERLPSLWPKLKKNGGVSDFHGEEMLKELRDFALGKSIPDPQNLSNTHLAPLTVVSHVVDFVRIADDLGKNNSLLEFQAAQGFCIGFFPAAAIASSSNWTEFEHNVSNALRLAACTGIVIDAENASHTAPDRGTAVSVRWKTAADRAYLETSLDLFPEAYISCITDDRMLTITLPSRSQTSFCCRLSEAKIATAIIGLDGCYHHSRHAKAAQALKQLCAGNHDLDLPSADKLRMSLRSTADADVIATGSLHDIAIDLILCKRAHWFQTVKSTVGNFPQSKVKFVQLGRESCVPRSLLSNNPRLNNGVSHHDDTQSFASGSEEVAVVGMACRFPQADSIEEFWQLVSSGRTSIANLPIERFNPADINREPKLASYWGNFLRRPDAFDHRFFGISGREAKSMDPQQRLALQVAYEALESSGYCSLPLTKKETNVGCYLGVGSVDYEGNVASENANAFSATGTLRAFISGRISHFFGFLNPNGASRAFDAAASGYCRGEGAGILVLKSLSMAVADGDTILGVIAASAVNQGSNCSSITVPDSQSQSSLYRLVCSIGQIEPQEVTYVEAHGTGTPVGDPVEYESIQLALAGPRRKEELFLGSVKDNIGHTESASGAAGVIKTLLMMQYKTIPKQANFVSLNPHIKVSPSDRITVPKATQSWNPRRHIALVNNYGAAGSNVAIAIRDMPSSTLYPILLSAKSARSLQLYMDALKVYSPKFKTSIGAIAGTIVYKLFSGVVEYANYYRGVKSLSALGDEAVGIVTVPTERPFSIDRVVCDPISLDNFLQVAGIHVNCLSNRKDDEVFMCTAIEEVIVSASFMTKSDSCTWTVYSRYETTSKVSMMNDIFIYDSNSRCLVLAILGASFRSVPFKSLPVDRFIGSHEPKDKLVNGYSGSSREILGNDTGYEEPDGDNLAMVSRDCFIQAKASYDQYAKATGFASFCTEAFPLQSDLVVQYVVVAFASLGCALQNMEAGNEVPTVQYDLKHKKLIPQLYKVLEDAGLVRKDNGGRFCRTATPVPMVSAHTLHAVMMDKFPQHASETKLLHTTAHRLADCLSGAADPLALLFGDAAARALLEDVYTNAPMFKTGTLLLGQYLSSALERLGSGREVRILELGAGTGGTTKHLVQKLTGLGTKHRFSYTFTDLSSSLVAAARRKFAKWSFMHYAVLDIEDPEPQFTGAYDIIISTNCIHATKDLVQSTSNICKMLRANGVLCLVELTRNLPWLDLVFGLLEGWWLFSDGREHALADERRWEQCLHAAGFAWVDWSDSVSEESDILRVITASPSNVVPSASTTTVTYESHNTKNSADQNIKQTLVFKNVNGLDLCADIYYPPAIIDPGKSFPVGIRPPEAILAFYCPSDYEDPFWTKPNFPAGSEVMAITATDQSSSYELDAKIWAGVSDCPITSYNIPPTKRALGGWLAPSDPRSRLALYMNFHGRTLHVLLNGLDKRSCREPSAPTPADVVAVSPLAHIRRGKYTTPTFIIHPRQDDLIPWQQAQLTWEVLRAKGIDAELRIVENVPHLFDMYREYQANEDKNII
ncbi:hypothetical protein DV737_g5363, partial [Chaetothyriales sp. CBS 132003]